MNQKNIIGKSYLHELPKSCPIDKNFATNITYTRRILVYTHIINDKIIKQDIHTLNRKWTTKSHLKRVVRLPFTLGNITG